MRTIGRAELIGDPRFEVIEERSKHEPEVDEMIAAWSRQRDKHEAMRILGAAGVPAGAVLDTMELLNDANFEQRGIVQVMQHPAAGPFKMPTWPVRLNGSTPAVAPAPLLGEHTEEVLEKWLGMGSDAIGELRKCGAL